MNVAVRVLTDSGNYIANIPACLVHGCLQSPPQWQQVVDVSFTVAFTLEMSLKLMALGLQYFTDGWNWLDAAVVFEVG